MKKDIIKIVIKVLIYALGLIGAYLGVSAMTSCTVHRSISSRGSGMIISTDTIYVIHDGDYSLKIK